MMCRRVVHKKTSTVPLGPLPCRQFYAASIPNFQYVRSSASHLQERSSYVEVCPCMCKYADVLSRVCRFFVTGHQFETVCSLHFAIALQGSILSLGAFKEEGTVKDVSH